MEGEVLITIITLTAVYIHDCSSCEV